MVNFLHFFKIKATNFEKGGVGRGGVAGVGVVGREVVGRSSSKGLGAVVKDEDE